MRGEEAGDGVRGVSRGQSLGNPDEIHERLLRRLAVT